MPDGKFYPEDFEEVARVRVTKSRTWNLENYESMRVEISIELPCSVGDIKATLEKLERGVEREVLRNAPGGENAMGKKQTDIYI